jgi:molybdopterin-guanine dinucleotide biosynthesis protein B
MSNRAEESFLSADRRDAVAPREARPDTSPRAATLAAGMKIFGLAGWSGSGKTTLVVKLVPELIGRGLTVSTVKHAHHGFDVDRPGKDSFEHRAAGATEVLVTSPRRWALIRENRGLPEPAMEELVARMAPVDLLLIEGFKRYRHDKLEVHRPAIGRPLLCREDPNIVAVAADAPLTARDPDGRLLPVLDLNDIPAAADFIVGHCALEVAAA